MSVVDLFTVEPWVKMVEAPLVVEVIVPAVFEVVGVAVVREIIPPGSLKGGVLISVVDLFTVEPWVKTVEAPLVVAVPELLDIDIVVVIEPPDVVVDMPEDVGET